MAKDIKTKVKLEGEAEFNRQMAAMNNGLKTTRSDMAALSAEFEGNLNTTKALTAKQKLLQSTYDQQKAKVDALNAQYEKAKSEILTEACDALAAQIQNDASTGNWIVGPDYTLQDTGFKGLSDLPHYGEQDERVQFVDLGDDCYMLYAADTELTSRSPRWFRRRRFATSRSASTKASPSPRPWLI